MTIFDDELTGTGGERDIDLYRRGIPGMAESGLYLIRADKLPELTDLLMMTVANTVADIIGAGSERDAVLENDELRMAIMAELHGWSDDQANMAAYFDEDRPPGSDASPEA